MSNQLNIKFIPLSFISSEQELKRQIENTIVFSHLASIYPETSLFSYLENTQYGYTASASEAGTHKLVRITDINDGSVNWETVPFCDCDAKNNYQLKENDILVARTGGTTGKSFLVKSPPDNVVFASYLIRLRVKEKVNIEFIHAFLNSYLYWSQISEMKSGSAQPNVNAEKLKTLILPKCPIEVQNQIVLLLRGDNFSEYPVIKRRLDKTLGSLAELNEVRTENQTQAKLLTKLRKAYLQEAVMGQLTADWREQNPTQDTGKALLTEIKKHKAQLIKAGKLRKEKPLNPIKPEEIPFKIPDNWTWCRLGEIGLLERGKSKHRPRNDERLFQDGTYPFIQTGDVSQSKKTNNQILSYGGFYNEFGLAQSKIWNAGTLCITIAANIAETGFLTFDACFPDSIVAFSPLIGGDIISYFVRYFLEVSKTEIEKYAPATAQKNINLGILDDLFIPLPPLTEQQAIVSKIEGLLAQVEGLEKENKAQQEYAQRLMGAVLQEAFGGSKYTVK